MVHIRLFLRRLGLLVLTYQVLRLGFHLWNWKAFAAAPVGAVLGAYARSWIFDLSGILTVSAPWAAASLLMPVRWLDRRDVQRGLLALWLLGNAPFIALNLSDYAYYSFINRRSTDELVALTGDIARQLPALLVRYWVVPIGVVGLVWVLARLYPRLRTTPTPRPKLWADVAPRVVLGFLVFLAIRGSVGLKPLRVGDAFAQQPAVLGNLTLNSTFTFLKSIADEPLERKDWFPSLAAARTALDPTGALWRYSAPPPPPLRDNVVLLILESFASEYNGVENGGQGYTPFLDSLATAPGALLFRDHYANGHKSIESLPALLTGFPALIDEPLITSTYQANTITGLPDLLKSAGYHTAFFHGAANGSMGFSVFTKRVGMERYFGLNEYPGREMSPDFDGTWGILDEPYLQYFSRQLTALGEPFFGTLFTLSSHEPYPVPKQYAARLPKGTLPIHQSIGYTDLALRRFFASARRQPWYGHTLFILLADHAQQTDRPGYQNTLGLTKTPLLLFRPGATWPTDVDPHRITQQADVPATVADYLHLPAPGRLLPYGVSALDPKTNDVGRAIFRDGGSTWLVHRDYVTELTADEQVRYYTYRIHELGPPANPPTEIAQRYAAEVRAAIQFTNNGLVENAFYKAE